MTMLMMTMTIWSSAVHRGPTPPSSGQAHSGTNPIQLKEEKFGIQEAEHNANLYGAEGIPKNAGVQLKIKLGNAGVRVTSEVAQE